MAIAGSLVLLLYGVALIAFNTRRLLADWKRSRVRHNVDLAFIQIYLGAVLIGVAGAISLGVAARGRVVARVLRRRARAAAASRDQRGAQDDAEAREIPNHRRTLSRRAGAR